MTVTVKKFSATWCQPCKRLAPVFESAVKPKYVGQDVIFEDVDIDHDNNAVANYGVRSVPTVIIEQNGEVLHRIIGLNPVNVYTSAIDELL